MSEVQINTQLDLQTALFVAEQAKPFIDAEVNASPAIKRAAQEMISHAMNDAENTYEQTKDLITDPVKAETIAYRAKPAIDAAAESGAASRAASEAQSETTSRLYSEIDVEDDNQVYSHPDYVAAHKADNEAWDKASRDAKLANQVVEVLDKSYDTPEGK